MLLVGDAAGYVDALTGEGLRVGFAEAQAAVDGDPAQSTTRYEARGRGSPARTATSPTHCSASVPSPRLRPMIVPTAQALPRTFTRIVDQIAG